VTPRLLAAWHRLYLPTPPASPVPAGTAPALLGPQGEVRALVLGLARPADWSALSAVWTGVQADLGLPAPAIAVDGQAACQLWFSVDAPISAAEARAFLQGLCDRHLADVKPERLSLWPAPGATADAPWRHAAPVPAQQAEQADGECWSAFVAPDLAPVFADTPWLDIPPGDDNQAELLGRLQPMRLADFRQALAHLAPAPLPAPSPSPASSPAPARIPDAGATSPPVDPALDTPLGTAQRTALAFLLGVVQDPSVALAQRIEAAKALLQAHPGHP
jgi:hypothetical protein